MQTGCQGGSGQWGPVPWEVRQRAEGAPSHPAKDVIGNLEENC